MHETQDFIRISLEINLFFQRIMKEHLFFIETNLQPVQRPLIAQANLLKHNFEHLLAQSVRYSMGVISENSIAANEFVTPYTLNAENTTALLTGASINTNITKAEYELKGATGEQNTNIERLLNAIKQLNTETLRILERTIAFKKRLLDLVSECKIFITMYNEMLEHLIHEAEYYKDLLTSLVNTNHLPQTTLCGELNFWNHIMEEHALFINGMLDPSEKDLKGITEKTANAFEMLIEDCLHTPQYQIILKSTESATAIRNLKRSSTEAILHCEIKSIIPPLLADHVLREANHYLRLLAMLRRYTSL